MSIITNPVFAGFRNAASVAFSPLSISSFKFGIEARNLSLANTAAIASMADIKGGSNAAQGTAGQRPSYRNDLYAFPVARFDGSNDCLQTPAIDLTATNKLHTFTVFKAVGLPASGTAGNVSEFSNSFSGNAGTFVEYLLSDGKIEAGNNDGSQASYADSNSNIASSFVLLETVIDRSLTLGEVTVYKNGVNDASGRPIDANTTGNFGNFALNIGSRSQTGNFAPIDLVGKWIFADVLTGANLSKMRAYAGAQGGLTL